MLVKLFTVGCEFYTLVCTHKKCAAKLFFECADCSCEVWLVAVKYICGTGYTSVSCHIIENSVVVIVDVHNPPLLISKLHIGSTKYAFYVYLYLYYNIGKPSKSREFEKVWINYCIVCFFMYNGLVNSPILIEKDV